MLIFAIPCTLCLLLVQTIVVGTPQRYLFLDPHDINLLESPQPCPSSSSAPPSRSGYPRSISGTKCGTIDPLVSKRPEKNGIKWSKMVKNGSKWFKMVPNGPKWQKMVKNGQNCQKWSKSPKMVKIAKNGLKWSKMVQNDPKWFQMVQNRPKW